ncbi:MAG: NAD(P)H-quinone oxidoreductase [Nevskiaceae bacterium]|nr:MAG: NAD(P)H-quinone oxidoreductase [Nevskiaceae bacterium]TBR74873.1 MAG: NAD(P)H-quinone oxidoreductase [Nevskiaceae bacterium]
MRYIDHGQGGAAEVLHVAEGLRPAPRAGEVLLHVAYAGVNRPDLLQRAGAYPPPQGTSPVLGLEVSGHVAALGSGCTRWRVGDAVCALVPGGGYAEYCVVPEVHCLPLPAGVSLQDAAGLPEVCFTVWANVFRIGALQAGERLLVHGGSSGIGVMAIQLARAFGARVATTVGNAAKQAFCRELGAELAVNYREEDFEAVVRSAWGGVDVVLDMVGGAYAAKNVRLLARGGRLVQIAVLGGAKGEVDLAQIMVKRLVVTGSTLRARSIEDKAALAQELQVQVWPLFATGAVRPIVQRVYDLADVVQAHRELERSQHIGKVLLRVGGGGMA